MDINSTAGFLLDLVLSDRLSVSQPLSDVAHLADMKTFVQTKQRDRTPDGAVQGGLPFFNRLLRDIVVGHVIMLSIVQSLLQSAPIA